MTIFLLKLSLCWGVFALLYQGLLRYETFFRANRIYLLCSIILGIMLAMIPGEQLAPPMSGSSEAVLILPVFTHTLEQVEIAATQWKHADYLWLVYWIGFVVMAARMIWGLLRLSRMIYYGRQDHLSDGSRIVYTAEAQTPFSFFHWIFIPNTLHTKDLSADARQDSILAHERAHARGGHSADVLLAEMLCVIFWFHPLVHWYKRAMRAVHEYLADAAASRRSNRKQYGLLLIGQSQFGMPIAFANHFFHSPLKQRLVMLTKKTSSPLKALKFGLLVPIVVLITLVFRQMPANAQVVNPTRDNQTTSGTPASKSADAAPEFPGGMESLVQYLLDNVKYPKAAEQVNAEGTVVVSFVVEEDGTLSEINAAPKYENGNPDLIAEAIRVVSTMPKWKPAVKEGKIVKMQFSLPIKFALESKDNSGSSKLDKMPEHPGGHSAMMAFLRKNIKYPEAPKEAGISGVAMISFVVEKDGTLSDFEALSSPHPDLAEEAIRVLKLMPKFNPGMKNGVAVPVKLTVPARFSL